MMKVNKGAILLWQFLENKMKKIFFIFVFMCCSILKMFAGVNPSAFLNTGVGARAMGLGGAFVSLSDDATAMYWNPAGLAKNNRYSITAMGQSLSSTKWDTLNDINPQYQYIGITFPLNNFSIPGIYNKANTFGIGMISSGLKNVTYTTLDSSGKIVRDTFDDIENAYFISYGFPVLFSRNNDIYAGLTLKYITQTFTKIEGASAYGFDADFGLIYTLNNFNVGFLLQRGVDLKWSNGRTDLGALTTKLGISNKFIIKNNFSLLGSFDVTQRQNQPLTANFGTEFGCEKTWFGSYLLVDGIFLRLGIDTFALEDRYGYRDKINSNINYTAGMGINLMCCGYKLQLDYALGSYLLGDKNRISLNLYF